LILQGVNLIKFITVTNEEFLIRYITTIFSDMKIITSKLTLLIVLSTIIVVVVVGGNLTISQTSMADNIDKSFTSSSSSSSLHPISVQNLDTTADSNQYHDSFVWSHSSASKMTDVLTASFTNILDTQIYAGLDKVAN
jgi:hypothetical protein